MRPISSAELSEWIAYERVAGPIGDRRGDLHAALVALTIASAFRGKGRAPKLEDFLFEFDRSEQSPEEMLAILQGLTSDQKKG